jgi:oxidoreductase
MDALRGAIVGFGGVAEHGHWPVYRESAAFRIVAVVDASDARLAAARGLDAGLRTYRSLDELASHETLDFVDICTPPSGHAAQASHALNNGWHVLCEKPLTLDPDRYRDLRDLSERRGRVLFTVHNWKMAPIVRAAFEAVSEGRIGSVRAVDLFTWRNSHCKGAPVAAGRGDVPAVDENWRIRRSTACGGVLVDHGWHAFYLVTSLVGATPLGGRATMHLPSAEGDALEDSVDVAVRFAAAETRIHLTWRASVRRNLIVVSGDRGTVVVDDDRLALMPREGAWSDRAFEAPLSGGSHHADWFDSLLHAFGREIGDPAARGVNLGEAGWCVALTDAAYRSARANGIATDVTAP